MQVGLGVTGRAEDEDEQRHEGQVDEEHRLDQTDRQEEDGLESTLGLGLTSYALDIGRTGQTVTDTGSDGATGEGDAATDEGTGQLDRSFCCHLTFLLVSRRR